MRYLQILFLISPFFNFAQITVTKSDFSDGGDTVRISLSNNLAVDFLPSGQNYSWNFSDLSPSSQSIKEYKNLSSVSALVNIVFGSFASANYQATNYNASNAIPLDQIGSFLPVSISEVNSFSKNAITSITSVGMSAVVNGNEIPFKSDTIESRYIFPLAYGDSYSSRGYTNMNMNPVYDAIWRQYRTRNSFVDGWGSVTTPFGTFDVIRAVHTIDEIDSLYITFSGFGSWIELPVPQSIIYEWIANGEKEPILRITTNVINGNENVSSIEYKDIYRETLKIEKNTSNFQVNIFPNPVNEELLVENMNRFSLNYTILDLKGKVHCEGSISEELNQIDIENIPSGQYIIQFFNVGNRAVYPFVKN